MPLHIVRNDLSNMRTQAVVCPSNSELRLDGGAGGAVARKAGMEQLQHACDALGGCPTGKAVVTPAFDFPADVLVHAVGPVWHGGQSGEWEALRSCVTEALTAAFDAGAETVALPLMSAGTFGFPPAAAIDVETHAIQDFLEDHDIDVWLVLYDHDSIRAGRRVFDAIEEYIDDVYVADGRMSEAGAARRAAGRRAMRHGAASAAPGPRDAAPRRTARRETARETTRETVRLGAGRPNEGAPARPPSPAPALDAPAADAAFAASADSGPCDAAPLSDVPLTSLAERLSTLDESFAQTVLRLIDERGMTDVEVYKRANMSRQLFAKIRRDDNYRPTKKTACALAFALGLSHADALALLARAGFTLSHSSKFDIIVEYFLMQGICDIYQVNEALFAFDQQLLG